MTNKIEELEEKMKKQNKNTAKRKVICPECKSGNVETEGNYLAQKSITCKDCGYRGTQLLEVERE